MTTDKNNSPVTAPMWWDGGDRAITAREKATIEEHGPSCFSIALVPIAQPDSETSILAAQEISYGPKSADSDAAGSPESRGCAEEPRRGCEGGSCFTAIRGVLHRGVQHRDGHSARRPEQGPSRRDHEEGCLGRVLTNAGQSAALAGQQGDVRSLAEHITDHLCHHEYDIGGRNELLACVVEALAATGKQQAGAVPAFTAAVDAVHLLADYLGDAPQDLNLEHEISLLEARDAIAYALAARQPGAQVPITVEAVATVRRSGEGDRYIYWLTEGGIADLEAGDVLMVSDRAITNHDGSGEVYAAPPAQGIDLTYIREMAARWRMDEMREGMGWREAISNCADQLDVALALIDSQRDAAPGVGS